MNMSMIELNQEELMMVEAMVNCALHAEIAHNPPLVRLTPERQAFLRAMQTHPVTMQTLPGYLAHIGIDIKRLNAIDVLNYVAGQFYTGNKTTLRVLDPSLLRMHCKLSVWLGNHVDEDKISREYILRMLARMHIHPAPAPPPPPPPAPPTDYTTQLLDYFQEYAKRHLNDK